MNSRTRAAALGAAACLAIAAAPTVQAQKLTLICHTVKNNTSQAKTDYHVEVQAGNTIAGAGKGSFDKVTHTAKAADWEFTGGKSIGVGKSAKIYIKTLKDYDPQQGTWTPLHLSLIHI